MLLRHNSFRPPAPVPYPNTPGPLDLVRTLWSNPIEAWTKAHFEEPIVRTSLPFGDVVVVNDPAAVRRVLQENETNYCKDRFQKRIRRSQRWPADGGKRAVVFATEADRTAFSIEHDQGHGADDDGRDR